MASNIHFPHRNDDDWHIFKDNRDSEIMAVYMNNESLLTKEIVASINRNLRLAQVNPKNLANYAYF